jgi:glutamyl-tRNA synthetase
VTTGRVRVRFAPSPTGFLHLGGMRSALFNWLYAQKTGGTFILRMEDTDRERLVPEAVDQIKASHAWLGLEPDETATQSERLELYKKRAEELVSKGALYSCWCTPERLDSLREEAKAAKRAFKYDRHCLDNPQEASSPHVLRFRIPDDIETIGWKDAVRGELSFKREDLDDFVAIKSDGYPTYNFANVVDDHEMQITHVLRAEEFLSSTPKHLLLYGSFGWEPPVFAHLPQVLGPDGSKLSKRHGAKSALDYRDEGYLPEAVVNFLALLGWNPGEGSTKEIYSREELIEAFSLERIQKSPAVFDPARLDWMNGEYIRAMRSEELMKHTGGFWPAGADDDQYKLSVLQLVQDRLKKLSELTELTSFFFADPKLEDIQQYSEAGNHMKRIIQVIENTEFDAELLETRFRSLTEELGTTTKALFSALRYFVTGSKVSPPLFETMAVLGKETVLRRMNSASKLLQV